MVAPLLRMVASRRFMKALMPQQYLSCGAHQSPALVCFACHPDKFVPGSCGWLTTRLARHMGAQCLLYCGSGNAHPVSMVL